MNGDNIFTIIGIEHVNERLCAKVNVTCKMLQIPLPPVQRKSNSSMFIGVANPLMMEILYMCSKEHILSLANCLGS